jgi:hypothetical protein
MIERDGADGILTRGNVHLSLPEFPGRPIRSRQSPVWSHRGKSGPTK